MPEVTNVGVVEKATIPNGWFELPRPLDPFADGWNRSFTLHSNPRVEMSFRYRGIALDRESAREFKEVLETKRADKDDEKLTPREIRNLQVVMGYETAGDNQYTFLASSLSSRSAAHLSSVRQPVFDLHSAVTHRIKNKTVLFVEGQFRSGNFYAGIFYGTGSGCEFVEEFMIHAPTQELFKKFSTQFHDVLKSFVWQE
ncbi:MAG: hypothetical protein K2Z81_23525 [Cyanobacteria bacterium]|nr:hypothetical protein [Cyanobacteriota bacterium]